MIVFKTLIINRLFFFLLVIRFVLKFEMRFRLHCFHLSNSFFYDLTTCNIYVLTNASCEDIRARQARNCLFVDYSIWARVIALLKFQDTRSIEQSTDCCVDEVAWSSAQRSWFEAWWDYSALSENHKIVFKKKLISLSHRIAVDIFVKLNRVLRRCCSAEVWQNWFDEDHSHKSQSVRRTSSDKLW
jgi:hypothetical protein